MILEKIADPLNEAGIVGNQPRVASSLAVNAFVSRASGNTRLSRDCMEDGE